MYQVRLGYVFCGNRLFGPGWSISTGDHVALDPVGRAAHAWKVNLLIGAGADRVDEGVAGRQACVVVAHDLLPNVL